ncbi:MAG: hypothetical protein V1816_24780 [Pseudomonadota bacterium]
MSRDRWIPLDHAAAPGEGLLEAGACFPADSGWLDGHFPQKPIVPGVALLALVLETACRLLGREGPPAGGFRLKKIKFKQLVLPDQNLRARLVRLDAESPLEFSFDIFRETTSVCSGIIILEQFSEARGQAG